MDFGTKYLILIPAEYSIKGRYYTNDKKLADIFCKEYNRHNECEYGDAFARPISYLDINNYQVDGVFQYHILVDLQSGAARIQSYSFVEKQGCIQPSRLNAGVENKVLILLETKHLGFRMAKEIALQAAFGDHYPDWPCFHRSLKAPNFSMFFLVISKDYEKDDIIAGYSHSLEYAERICSYYNKKEFPQEFFVRRIILFSMDNLS